jgi:hypothetical protein
VSTERRKFDVQVDMLIDKIDNIEKKMDLFVSDFKHSCELKHLALDKYIRDATDKMPIGNCNDRMTISERVISRHTVYWGIFIVTIPFAIGTIVWIIDKLFAR